MAGGAIDLDEVAPPEILDPRQVQRPHSGLCSRNVLIHIPQIPGVLKAIFRLIDPHCNGIRSQLTVPAAKF